MTVCGHTARKSLPMGHVVPVSAHRVVDDLGIPWTVGSAQRISQYGQGALQDEEMHVVQVMCKPTMPCALPTSSEYLLPDSDWCSCLPCPAPVALTGQHGTVAGRTGSPAGHACLICGAMTDEIPVAAGGTTGMDLQLGSSCHCLNVGGQSIAQPRTAVAACLGRHVVHYYISMLQGVQAVASQLSLPLLLQRWAGEASLRTSTSWSAARRAPSHLRWRPLSLLKPGRRLRMQVSAGKACLSCAQNFSGCWPLW